MNFQPSKRIRYEMDGQEYYTVGMSPKAVLRAVETKTAPKGSWVWDGRDDYVYTWFDSAKDIYIRSNVKTFFFRP